MYRESRMSSYIGDVNRPPMALVSKIALAVVALNIISMSERNLHDKGVNDAANTPDVQASQSSVAVDPRELLPNMRVIKIQHMNGEQSPSRYTDSDIQREVRSAGQVFEGLSNDILTLPQDISIHTIKLAPEGLHTDSTAQQSVECFSDEQLDRAQSLYLKNESLPSATSLMTVINQGDSCSMLPNGAVAMVDNVNGLRIGTMYGAVLTDNVILHEVGHILGLSHAASLYCDDPDARTVLEVAKTDIGKLVDNGCKIPSRDESGRPDVYSDRMTVMGGINSEIVDNFVERFSSIETTKLAPDIAKNQNVSTERASYDLSTRYEQLRTISFTLPAEHPLRQIDPDIDTLSIGVISANYDDAPTATVQVVAHHEHQSYRLSHAFPYIAGVDGDVGPVEVYHDETLGVKLIVSPGKNQSSVQVSVEPTK